MTKEKEKPLEMQDIDKIIERAVAKSLDAFIHKDDEKDARVFDYYKATEKILYNYPALLDIVADESNYMESIYLQRSKSITHYSSNSGYLLNPMEAKAEERQRSYVKTKMQVEAIDKILAPFRNDHRFKVIELYYFNWDEHGQRRAEEKRLSFEQIAERIIKEDGTHPEVKTVRRWRSQIVSNISIALFGIPAALSNTLTRGNNRLKMSE